ncbi:MAG: chloride channel protein [Phycisphaeraceae bacterium]|nr:chloride channel protein [Phycisphaeraceae bacterium]
MSANPSSHLWPLGRSIALAGTVGAVAGAGAILFHLLCVLVIHLGLTYFCGYNPDGPVNERDFSDIFAPAGALPTPGSLSPWALLAVIAAGGLLSGALVYYFAPEAEGHGTDSAIDAYHNKRGLIRPIVPIIKMLSSAITLGTGGSGGREGPISQIGAGVGSFLATRLKLSDAERRTLMSAGLGAGIGAIFHAPLAGAMFSVEVLYRDPDFESESLIPSFIATTVAYSVYGLAFGFQALFEVQTLTSFDNPLLLLPLTALAIGMALASWAYVRCLYGTERLFKKLALPRVFKPALGALLTAAVALAGYYALTPWGEEARRHTLGTLSIGYGFLQEVLSGNLISNAPLPVVGILLIVGLGKILTTSLTIGSGGSAGTFGPSMVIGGALGAVVGLAFQNWLPHLLPDVAHVVAFAILGMACFFAAAGKTPLSALILVSEVTSSYQLLLPSMWVCALAYLLSRGWTLYAKQVASRRDSPAHRSDFIIDVLSGLSIRDAMPRANLQFVTVPLQEPLADIAHLMANTRQTSFPVVDAQGRYYGLFGLADIRRYLYDADDISLLAVAQDLASPTVKPLSLDMDLGTAISQFAQGDFEELPVIDPQKPQQVIGLLRRVDVIAAYSARLLHVRREQAESAANGTAV